MSTKRQELKTQIESLEAELRGLDTLPLEDGWYRFTLIHNPRRWILFQRREGQWYGDDYAPWSPGEVVDYYENPVKMIDAPPEHVPREERDKDNPAFRKTYTPLHYEPSIGKWVKP